VILANLPESTGQVRQGKDLKAGDNEVLKGTAMNKDNENENETIIHELEEQEAAEIIGGEAEIVAKYDAGQARIIVQRNDFLVPNILQMVENRDILNLAPDYQRRKRWSDTKRSHLIESLLINIPIPPVFLYERDLAKYEVMDGQQRLSSIHSFFKNEFALKDLVKWPELNGKSYTDLPNRIQAGLNRRGLAAVIILTESGQSSESAMEIRQYVFERLNTGGEKLNAQEIRNCIYASHFNQMLIKLARSKDFTETWKIPPLEPDEPNKVSRALANNRLYSTMADCEIVLRFFTLRDMAQFKGGMKKALNDCMIRNKGLAKKECDLFAKEYTEVLRCAKRVFGPALFRLPNKKGALSGRHSVPLSDAILIGLDKLTQEKRAKIEKASDTALNYLHEHLLDSGNYEVLVGRANTKASIEERFKLVSSMFGKVLRDA
jgi:hypothetical protein